MAKDRVIHIGVDFDTSGMLTGINDIRKQLSSINVSSNMFKDVNKDLDKINKLTLEISSALKNGVPEKELSSLLKDLSTVNKIYTGLPDKIRQVSIQTSDIHLPPETLTRLDEIEKEIEKLGQEAKNVLGNDLQKSLRNAIPKDIISDDALKKINKADDKIAAFTDNINKLKERAKGAEKVIRDMMTRVSSQSTEKQNLANTVLSSMTNNSLEADRNNIAKQASTAKLTKTDYNELLNSIDAYNTAMQQSIQLQQIEQQIISIITNAETTAAQKAQQIAQLRVESTKLVNDQLQNNINIQQNAAKSAENSSSKIVKGNEQVTESLQKSSQHLQKQDSLLKQIATRATALIGIGAVFNYIRRGVRDAWNSIKELDKEFTSIAVVTDKTTSQLWQSFNTYAQMAQSLGVATKDAVATSALYYQQGLKTTEVMSLTAETIKMAQIAGMDFKTATNQMTAALRGFNLEMSQASMVNDIFSTLAANAAVDTKELSYALTKTASIAESAGMSIDTTSAFLAKMIETTREAPENIGTAMKSIVARFEELKKNPLALSVDVEGEEVVANKVEAAIALAGVRLRDEATGQFRDLDDVFLELAKSWEGLDRNTQRYIATIAAGSRQQSRFIALMDGYDRTLELVELAQDSEGQSAAQFLKTLDSLDSKINKIRNSLEQLYQKFVNSDFFGGLLEGLNDLLQNFGKWDASTLAVFVTAGVVIGNNLINGIKQSLRTSGDLFQILTTPNVLKPLQEKYSTALRSQMQAKTDLTNAQADLSVKNNKYNQELATYTNWFNNRRSTRLNYTINDAEAIAKIKALKTIISDLETQIKTPEQFGLDKTAAENKLKELQAELATTESDIKAKYGSDYSKRIGKTSKNNFDALTAASTGRLQAQVNSELAAQRVGATTQATEEARKQYEEQQKVLKEQAEKLKVSSADAFRNVGMSLVTSLSIGVTKALEEDDPWSAVSTSIATLGAQMTPLIMQQMTGIAAAVKAGTSVIAGAGGAVTIALEVAAAAITFLTPIVVNELKKIKSESKKLQDTIDDLQDKQKELEETSERTTAEAAVQKTTYKKLEKLKKEYFELYELSGRTAEENERLQTITSQIEEDFPDLVEKYTEAGAVIKSQKEDWQKILDIQKESAKQANVQAFSDVIAVRENKINTLELQQRKNKVDLDENFYKATRSTYDAIEGGWKGANASTLFAPILGLPGLIAGIIGGQTINNNVKEKQYVTAFQEKTSVEDYNKIVERLEATHAIPEEEIKRLQDLVGVYDKSEKNYQKELQEAKEQEEKIIFDYFKNYITSFGSETLLDSYSDETIRGISSKLAESKIKNREYNLNNVLTDEGFIDKILSSGALTTSEAYSLTSKKTQESLENYRKKLKEDPANADVTEFFGKEELKEFEEYVSKYIQVIYQREVDDAMQQLENFSNSVKGTDREGLLDILNNMGSYGSTTVTNAWNSLSADEQSLFQGNYDTWQKQSGELSDNGVLDRVIAKYGTDLAQYIKNQNLGQTAAEAVVESLNSLQLNGDEAKGLIDLINSITDWSDPTAIKQLSEEILKLTGNTELAVDAAFDLREAFENPFKMDLNATSAFTELGKQISDVKKKYKDLNSAIEEYNEYGRLSGETILSLVESGNIMYLSYDKQTKAVRINAEAVEAAFKMEMLEAKQSLELKRQNAIVALAELEREQSINEQKLTNLQNALKAETAEEKINALERLKEQKKEDKTELAVEQTNNELMIEESNNFFTQLQDAQKIGYSNLISLAKSAGEKQREAYIGSLSDSFDKNGAWTGDFGVVLATPTKYQSTDSLKEYEDRVNGIIKDIEDHASDITIEKEINKLIEETKAEIQENEKAQEAYREYLKAIEQGMSVVEAFTSSGMSDFYKDTSSALAEAKKELEDYVSTLEKYYNVQKRIEKLSEDTEKAKKRWQKTGSEEDKKAYEDALLAEGRERAQDRANYVAERDNDLKELQTSLAKYGISAKDIQLSDTGHLDLEKLRPVLERMEASGELNADTGKEVEDIINDKLSEIEEDTTHVKDADSWFEQQIEELEESKETLKEIKNSIDRLQNMEQALDSIEKLVNEAQELNEDYYSSGGREGMNGMQYLTAVGETIQRYNTAGKEYEREQSDQRTDIGSLYQGKLELGSDNKYYITQDYLNTIDASEDSQKEYEEIQRVRDEYNKLTDKIKENNDARRASIKGLQTWAKNLRQSYSNMVTRVAEAMAELDQREIDEVKKKYAMIQEEDDKYLNALQKSIDKQRKLREQANAYDDLEKDEKRLALLERDTSGANAAEIAALKEQIKDARQSLVDTEQDNIVSGISEENEERKNKMNEETEFLQNVMDERTYDMQYYIERAQDLVNAAIDGDAGAYQRMLSILQQAEEDFFRVTAEAKETWLEDISKEFTEGSDWRKLVLNGMHDIATGTTNEINETVKGFLDKESGYITTISGDIKELDNKLKIIKLDEKFDAATLAADGLIGKLNELKLSLDALPNIEKTITYKAVVEGADGGKTPITEDLVTESNKGRYNIVYDSSSKKDLGLIDTFSDAFKNRTKSQAGSPLEFKEIENDDDIKRANQLKLKDWGNSWLGSDNNTSKNSSEPKNPSVPKEPVVHENDIHTRSAYAKDIYLDPELLKGNGPYYVTSDHCVYDNEDEIPDNVDYSMFWGADQIEELKDKVRKADSNKKYIKKFATGGLVNYTGPAWVDGSPARPEAFLSVSDTRNIQTLTEVLSTLVSPSRSISAPERTNVKSGDTNLEIHIDVEQLADDYDVNQLLDVMQERISEASEGNVTIVK